LIPGSNHRQSTTAMSAIALPVHDRIRRDLDAGLTAGERLRIGFRIGTALAASVLLIAGFAVSWVFPAEQRSISESLKALAALLVLFPILLEAIRGVVTGSISSYSAQLVSIASLAAIANGDFTTAAVIPVILSVAFFVEERSVLGAKAAIDGLRSLEARSAHVLREDGTEQELDAEQIQVGDRLIVRPGETIPADGVVVMGHSSIDQSLITGESTPEDIAPGSRVFAGTNNHSGLLHVEVLSVGDDSTLGRVLDLLRDAEQSRTEIGRLIDAYAKYFVLGVLLIAGITLFLSRDISRAITVLVVGCPGPFILAGPAAMVAALANASRHGVLVKNASFLEALGDVDSVIFDKTGTVTLGELGVVDVQSNAGDAERLLRIAATCASASQHPVSRAIACHADEAGLGGTNDSVSANELPGRGVIVESSDERWLLGRRGWLEELEFALPAGPAHAGPIVWVARQQGAERECLGCILLADHARPDASATIDDLYRLGILRTTLLTGDRRAVAEQIAGELDLSCVIPEVLPDDKLDVVRAERRAGYCVMVVGDGMNDAPALAGGNVGVAMGAAGSQVALRSADIVLMSGMLNRLPFAIRLARQTRSTIHRSIVIGTGLTILMLGLASGGVISPIAGAILQNVGEVFVIVNSASLLRLGIDH